MLCKRTILIILFWGACMASSYAQTPDKEKRPRNGPAVSATLFRTRMYSAFTEDPVFNTHDLRLYFLSLDRFRLSVNYENEPSIDLMPEWRYVKSKMYDLEAYVTTPGEGSKLYFCVGLTYQQFTGLYTGHANVPHLVPYINKEYSADYYGLFVGAGLDIKLQKGFSLYCELRYRYIINNERAGHTQRAPTIMVQAGAGIKYAFRRLPWRKIFRGPNDRYHWF